MEGINGGHRNPLYLSDAPLPESVSATSDPAKALADARFVVSVVPSSVLRVVWQNHGDYLKEDAVLVSCTKGIEEGSLKLMHQVLGECLPSHPAKRRAVLSGPSS